MGLTFNPDPKWNNPNIYNQFQGWPIKPIKGDVQIFLDYATMSALIAMIRILNGDLLGARRFSRSLTLSWELLWSIAAQRALANHSLLKL